MIPLRRTLRALFRASIAALAASIVAANVQAAPRPSSHPSDLGGLQIQLKTDAHTFHTPNAQARGSFTAIAQVTNRGSALPFTFASPYMAEKVFKFCVFNSAGEQLWESEQNVRIAGGETVRALGRNQTWKRSIEVPLTSEGQPLAPGTYTLEARIDADPTMSASVIFRVVGSDPGPPVTPKEFVYSVTKVSARHVPTFAPPPEVAVEAVGTVPTGGWTNPELRLRGRAADGFLEFDFVAQPPPPDAVVTQAFQNISARAQVPVPEQIRGVRVFARTNNRTARLE